MAAKHYVIVEDCALPALRAGDAALDFCNTRAGWNGGVEGEYLETYEHLAVWAGFAGLLTADRVAHLRDRAHRHPVAARRCLRRARAARDRLYRALLEPEAPQGVEPFVHDTATAMRHLRLSVIDGMPGWQVDE